jgi:hypothetical protein
MAAFLEAGGQDPESEREIGTLFARLASS